MASHSSILAWKIPRTEEPGGLQYTCCEELDTTEQLSAAHILLTHVQEKWRETDGEEGTEGLQGLTGQALDSDRTIQTPFLIASWSSNLNFSDVPPHHTHTQEVKIMFLLLAV